MAVFTRMFSCMVLLGLLGYGRVQPSAHERSALANDASMVAVWNEIATDAIVVTGATAPAASGVLMAIVQLGVHDAVVAIGGGHKPYAEPVVAPSGASLDAAAAASAHDVLIDLLPEQAPALDEELHRSLANIPDGPAKADGIWVGRQAAAAILANRTDDGRFAGLTWANGYSITKAFGDINSTVRNDEQSEIAVFWTEHTTRQWNRNIRVQAAREDLDVIETARLLAVTNTAMADAWIGCWDAKYHYSFWRPVTAIQQGDTDRRSDTIGDPNWTPFRTTPNHPEYPGAHACVSTAAAHALRRFFRRDRTFFPMDAVVGSATYVHTFSRYSDAASEARDARIFGGMHYDFSNEAGASIGRQIVDWMSAHGYFRRAAIE